MQSATHLFVSPHLDDAALACGGTIAAVTRTGQQAIILTVFAGRDRHRTLTPRAARYHAKCGMADFWTRRWEDVAACTTLGAGQVHLEFPEVLYRRDRHGRPRVHTRDDLFSSLTDDDHLVLTEVTNALVRWLARLRPTAVYGPAGFGGHVDHALTSAAIQQVAAQPGDGSHMPLALYEEMPYAVWPDSDRTYARLRSDATPKVREVTREDWQRKLAAIGAYRSQLRSIWNDTDWQAALREHARELTGGRLGERTWAPATLPVVCQSAAQ